MAQLLTRQEHQEARDGKTSPTGAHPVTGQITNLGEWRTARGPRLLGTVQSSVLPTPAQAAAVQHTGGPAHVEVGIFEDGPWIHWWGSDPTELQVMALALMDAARAARNGDDLNDVARQEWTRRGGRPDPD